MNEKYNPRQIVDKYVELCIKRAKRGVEAETDPGRDYWVRRSLVLESAREALNRGETRQIEEIVVNDMTYDFGIAHREKSNYRRGLRKLRILEALNPERASFLRRRFEGIDSEDAAN